MIIHQSIYGEVDRAWALIRSSEKDITFSKNIALKTDLQEQTSGTVWKPAIRGFRNEDRFLIIKTFEDTTKGVRRGRKFSHVLIVQFKDIVNLSSIIPLFSFLPETIDKDMPLLPINFEVDESSNELKKIEDHRLRKLINGYTQLKEHKNNILWLGQESFELAIDSLWYILTDDERKEFQFGIIFNNDQKKNDGIHLYAVPDSVTNRFIKTENFVINKNEVFTSVSLLEKFLCGDEQAISRVENFKKIIECRQSLRSEINTVEKVIETFEKLDTTTDIKKLSTLSHLVAKYSPSESQGANFKNRLLKIIAKQVDQVSYNELIVLKIFKISSYQNSQQIFEDKLSKFIQKHIFSLKATSDDLKEFFNSLITDANHWWDLKIVQEISEFLNSIDKKKIKIIYRWLSEVPEVLQKIGLFLHAEEGLENEFSDNLPTKISEVVWDEMASLSIKKHWFKLYALLLLRKYPFEQALTELLKVDTDDNSHSGVTVITDNQAYSHILDFTLKNGDQRLIKICGKLCHLDHSLLTELNVLDKNWQQIWIESINCGNSISDGLTDPQKKVYTILDGIIDGKEIPDFLISKIAESDLANLIDYHRCSELWLKIPDLIRNDFLRKTSTALLEELSRNPSFSIPNDPIIEQHLSGKGITDYLYYNRENIKSVVPIFERYKHLADYNLKDYLNNYSGDVDSINAKRLGQLIYKRKFKSSADVIYKKANKHNNWKFALNECYHLFDLFKRGLIGLSGTLDKVHITTDEWWTTVHEVITDLYPNFNSLTTIWKKAGGKEADLLASGSSSDIWNDILYKLRSSKIKDVTMNDLLQEIKKQYGSNKNFEIIYKLRSTYIKTKKP